MSGELVYTSNWDIDEETGGPAELSGSCDCPECGDEVIFSRTLYEDNDTPSSGYSLDVECDCGCEFVVELS